MQKSGASPELLQPSHKIALHSGSSLETNGNLIKDKADYLQARLSVEFSVRTRASESFLASSSEADGGLFQ